jgi:hypothetical protein
LEFCWIFCDFSSIFRALKTFSGVYWNYFRIEK